MKIVFVILIVIGLNISSQAQSFIFNQLFRPSIRLNATYSHDFNFENKDRLHLGQSDINCIIPISSKLALDVDWKNLFKLRLRKALKLKVYQIFWNFRPKVVYLDLAYKDANRSNPFGGKPHFTYGFSTGITGIHLLPKRLLKPKFLFYQFNIALMEDEQSVQAKPFPSFTAMIGVAQMKSFNFHWYYGLYFSYNNGLIIPAPFLGFQFKLSPKVWVNITLPVQIKFSFKVSKSLKIDLGAGISGFSTAFGSLNGSRSIERHVFGMLRVRTGITFNIKLSPQTTLYLEGGAYPYQVPNFRWHQPTFDKPDLSTPIYGGFSLYYSFKKSLLGSTIDGLIMF